MYSCHTHCSNFCTLLSPNFSPRITQTFQPFFPPAVAILYYERLQRHFIARCASFGVDKSFRYVDTKFSKLRHYVVSGFISIRFCTSKGILGTPVSLSDAGIVSYETTSAFMLDYRQVFVCMYEVRGVCVCLGV